MMQQTRLGRHWCRAAGFTIFARRGCNAGAGPVLVLVHGVAVSSSYMAPLASALATHGHSVFAPDLPGYGRSSRPTGALDVPQLAVVLARWMRASGTAPAVLIANSFGCQVAIDLAARRPELVHALVLIGPTVAPNLRRFLRPLWRQARSLWYEHPAIIPLVMHDLIDMGLARALRMYYHCLHDRMEQKLPQVRVPALVIRGRHDHVADQPWCERVVRLLPNASFGEIPAAGHVAHYTRPTETAARITRFLSQPVKSGFTSARHPERSEGSP